MRTHALYKQKPLFRIKDSHLSCDHITREMMNALQAVIDSFGDSESLLAMQCRAALNKAKSK